MRIDSALSCLVYAASVSAVVIGRARWGEFIEGAVVVAHALQRVGDASGGWSRSMKGSVISWGRVGLHARDVLIRGAEAFHPRQPPPLQLGELALGGHDHQVVGAALPDIEPEGRREQRGDPAGDRGQPRDPDVLAARHTGCRIRVEAWRRRAG